MATTHIGKSTPNANTVRTNILECLRGTTTTTTEENSIHRLTWHGLSALIAVYSLTHSVALCRYYFLVRWFFDGFCCTLDDDGRGWWSSQPYGSATDDVLQNCYPLLLSLPSPELIWGSFHFVSNKMVRQFFLLLSNQQNYRPRKFHFTSKLLLPMGCWVIIVVCLANMSWYTNTHSVQKLYHHGCAMCV